MHRRLAVVHVPTQRYVWLCTGPPAPAFEADVLSPVTWWLRAGRGYVCRTRSPGPGEERLIGLAKVGGRLHTYYWPDVT